MDYEKTVVVSNQAQVRTMLQRAEANTRAFPFFLTDNMNGRRVNGNVVTLQAFCLDAMFRSSARAAPRRKRKIITPAEAHNFQRGYDVSASSNSSSASSCTESEDSDCSSEHDEEDNKQGN